ncbi:MAG: hypothetical protein A2033_01740 [Bacteroidetes bacterium GWA2_31_9]|nr:MAG: hypothetical protein A2033_01740 [Bacteroidetes bacterium GWA2_31_9]
MYLIVDSGSSKTDWVLIGNNKQLTNFNTIGLNPYFTDSKKVSETIKSNISIDYINQIDKVFFYGAGCSNAEKCEVIKSGIHSIIKNAEISVESDLLGAARALFKNDIGIAVILGTGSNAGFYNGKEISKTFGSFGYILGDEGSGTNLGLNLLKSYLNQEMPKSISEKLEKQYKLSKSEILENVYKKPFPNRYLAGFTKFLLENIEDDFIYSLVYNSFLSFLIKQIGKYDKNETVSIRFTGSIAFYFKDILIKVASHLNYKVDLILEKPIDELVIYHKN